jgi:hypothetical protein
MASSDEFYEEKVNELRELYDHLENALIAVNNASRCKGRLHLHKDQQDEMSTMILDLEDLLATVDDIEP